MKKHRSLPMKAIVSKTENVSFRVEPEIKAKLRLLSREGVKVAQCLHDNTVEWLKEVEKEMPLNVETPANVRRLGHE